VDENEKKHPSIEGTYRRGFAQGYWAAIRAAETRVPLSKIIKFFFDEILTWRDAVNGFPLQIPPVFQPPKKSKENEKVAK